MAGREYYHNASTGKVFWDFPKTNISSTTAVLHKPTVHIEVPPGPTRLHYTCEPNRTGLIVSKLGEISNAQNCGKHNPQEAMQVVLRNGKIAGMNLFAINGVPVQKMKSIDIVAKLEALQGKRRHLSFTSTTKETSFTMDNFAFQVLQPNEKKKYGWKYEKKRSDLNESENKLNTTMKLQKRHGDDAGIEESLHSLQQLKRRYRF